MVPTVFVFMSQNRSVTHGKWWLIIRCNIHLLLYFIKSWKIRSNCVVGPYLILLVAFLSFIRLGYRLWSGHKAEIVDGKPGMCVDEMVEAFWVLSTCSLLD